MEKIISIVGLTSSGKSDLAIFLAQKFNGEIVSADSRQVYKGLDFCSGKVSKEEQSIVPHHLLDEVNLGEQFSLFDFQKLAYKYIDEIIKKKKLPIMVGGTGLYSRSVVEGYNLSETKPDNYLRKSLEEKTLEELKQICKQKNLVIPSEPTKRRLIRLLEIDSGAVKENEPKYEVLQIGIRFSREEIYTRIEKRLKLRMPNMIEEIKGLLSQNVSKEFLRSLGLEAKFVVDYLDNKFASYDEFFEKLLLEERHFAKRQQTWYNKEQNLLWIDAHENVNDQAEKLVYEFLQK